MRAIRIAVTATAITYVSLLAAAYCWCWVLPQMKARADEGASCLPG